VMLHLIGSTQFSIKPLEKC